MMSAGHSHLKDLDYSVVQQCMHCGMCLPTCPTYDATKLERHSPRGRIALMRAIADDRLDVTKTVGEEMYFCLGCLACQTACPAGVNYAELFEHARAEVEDRRILDSPRRKLIRWFTVKWLFMDLSRLLLVGRALQCAGAVSAAVTALLAGLTRSWDRTKALALGGSSIWFLFAVSLIAGPVLACHASL